MRILRSAHREKIATLSTSFLCIPERLTAGLLIIPTAETLLKSIFCCVINFVRFNECVSLCSRASMFSGVLSTPIIASINFFSLYSLALAHIREIRATKLHKLNLWHILEPTKNCGKWLFILSNGAQRSTFFYPQSKIEWATKNIKTRNYSDN